MAEQPHLLARNGPARTCRRKGGTPGRLASCPLHDPRFVRPESIMPSFAYLGRENIKALIAYKQSLGFKDADFRVKRQREWKAKAIAAYRGRARRRTLNGSTPMVPEPWRALPNPYPITKRESHQGPPYLPELLHRLSRTYR